jgi:molybdopterin converting factor small subunit
MSKLSLFAAKYVVKRVSISLHYKSYNRTKTKHKGMEIYPLGRWKISDIVQIILYGNLQNDRKDSPYPSEKLLNLAKATSLKNVIHELDIKRERVQLVMRNHHAVSKDAVINPGDRVAFFPVEYPVYPDWNDFRF